MLHVTDQPVHTEQQELTTMQPHDQPRVLVIVIDVKCYNIIQTEHVKRKQNGGCVKYYTFVLENMGRRTPKNHRKSCKVSTDTSATDVFCHLYFYCC